MEKFKPEEHNNEYVGRTDNRPVSGSGEIQKEDVGDGDDEALLESFEKKDAKNKNTYFFDVNELPDTGLENEMDLKATIAVLKNRFPSGKIHFTEKEFAELDPDEQKIIKSLNAQRKYKDAA